MFLTETDSRKRSWLQNWRFQIYPCKHRESRWNYSASLPGEKLSLSKKDDKKRSHEQWIPFYISEYNYTTTTTNVMLWYECTSHILCLFQQWLSRKTYTSQAYNCRTYFTTLKWQCSAFLTTDQYWHHGTKNKMIWPIDKGPRKKDQAGPFSIHLFKSYICIDLWTSH